MFGVILCITKQWVRLFIEIVVKNYRILILRYLRILRKCKKNRWIMEVEANLSPLKRISTTTNVKKSADCGDG